MGDWDLTVDMIHGATKRAKDAMAALEGKKECRVTSPAGTDVSVSIEGRPSLEVTPIKKRGQMMGPLPLWAEVAFAAVEDRTEGTIVVDGVMLGIGLPGQVTEPITWKMENGRATAIEGGDDARRLRELIDGVENADVAGEFAFGTSEMSPFGSPSEKGRVGTVHFALGDNHNAYPGGQNVCPLHLDGVSSTPACRSWTTAPTSSRTASGRCERRNQRRRARRASSRSSSRAGAGAGCWSPASGSTAPPPRSATRCSRPARATASVSHETDEVAYVVSRPGRARHRRRRGAASPPGTRSTSRPGSWHAVVNTGDADVVMVFGFPHPDYPPTERR